MNAYFGIVKSTKFNFLSTDFFYLNKGFNVTLTY